MRQRCKGTYCVLSPLEGQRYCAGCLQKAQAKYKAYSALYDKQRMENETQYRKFYNSADWKTFRKDVLAANPICQQCCKSFSSEVHHVVAIKVDWSKRLDKDNVKAWCKPCHSSYEASLRSKGQK